MSDSAEKQANPAKPRVPLIAAPQLPYRPRDPKRFRPGIAIVGCGGISKWHLRAYKNAGYHVVAFCDMMSSPKPVITSSVTGVGRLRSSQPDSR